MKHNKVRFLMVIHLNGKNLLLMQTKNINISVMLLAKFMENIAIANVI